MAPRRHRGVAGYPGSELPLLTGPMTLAQRHWPAVMKAMRPRFQPRIFEGDNIFGVVRDDFDVQYLATMRIER